MATFDTFYRVFLGANAINSESITIAAGQSYSTTDHDAASAGLWSILETSNSGGKFYFNIGYNASTSTYPGLDIVSKVGGIERFVEISKANGYNFTINNVSNSNITIRLKKEI